MENIIYKDLDLTLNMHPVTKDLVVSTNTQAILRSIRSLILTQKTEKPFNPMIGSRVRSLLFENIDIFTSASLRVEIEQVIKNYEPRVNLTQVIVDGDPDRNSYNISIYFTFVGSTKELKIDFALTRLR